MSKETIHRCDLCKNVIKGQHATLTIPKPRKESKQANADYINAFMSLSLFGNSDESNTKKYDVCVPCAVGLLRLTIAAHELRELEEA